jgi:hypothetical protein
MAVHAVHSACQRISQDKADPKLNGNYQYQSRLLADFIQTQKLRRGLASYLK